MKITFRIHYHTVWGEELKVVLDGQDACAVELTTRDGNWWQGSAQLEDLPPGSLVSYRYAVFRDGQCVRTELGSPAHTFYTGNAQLQHFIVTDHWRDLPAEAFRFSSAYNTAAQACVPSLPREGVGRCICIRALCPGLELKGRKLAIAGSEDILGAWNSGRALHMTQTAPGVWMTMIDAELLHLPCEYKFVAVGNESGLIEQWEEGDNRQISLQPLLRSEVYVSPEAEVSLDGAGVRVAGTAIPVFSLRSEGSCGIGDFGDLLQLVDWAASTHQRAIQILPINDTSMTGTWMDSYPYNGISIYAFHPGYIDLRQAGTLKDTALAQRLEEQRAELNALPYMEYEKVMRLKHTYLRALYVQEGTQVLDSEDFIRFFQQNEEWLIPYAAFSYLREKYGTADFNTWPAYSTYVADEVQKLCAPQGESYSDIAYHYYLQYLLHIQLSAVAEHARRQGIILKGDIPIGISRTSVEAWAEPRYFNMNGQAGAPPDAFSANGQNWGFPTYNWQVMATDGYSWWRRRFTKMAEYFTAYRIDHILGFFRIWQIPSHSIHGLLGHFVPSLPLTPEEICSFGLQFRKEEMTLPYITERMLHELFGRDTEKVRSLFLIQTGSDRYVFRPQVDTQRKVETWFRTIHEASADTLTGSDNVMAEDLQKAVAWLGSKTEEETNQLRENLYSLISNVLFVADSSEPEKYHPRICAQNDRVFELLNRQEQEAFNHLYDHYYYQRHNEFWYHEAMKKLPVLTQSTSMLVCGEDLGMVPGCVPWVMNQLQILSLEIQRMPKAPGQEFADVAHYPVRSVCTIGTHDMSTLRGWWKEDPQQTERFYHQTLQHWGDAPSEAPGWICEEVVRQHLDSPSLLCILTFQDWLSMIESLRNPDIDAERINIPANPRHYWRWRMHLTLEELMQCTELNEKIQQLIEDSDRR